MKKKCSYQMLSVLLVAGLLCGCGTSGKKVETQTADTQTADTQAGGTGKTDAGYAAYNGFAYTEEGGQKKYILDTQKGIRLYCYFQSGSEEYEEVIYDLELSEAEGASAEVIRVVQEQGEDLTPSFKKFSFVFYPEKVVMMVERDTDLMAGGDSDNLQTGTYTMFASDWTPGTPAATAEKQDMMAPYQGAELGAMARAYYLKENNFLAPEIECVENDDGTTTIHLYEIVEDGEEVSHTGTSAWYTVDGYGKGKDDVMGNAVEFSPMSLGEIAEYMETPIALTYSENGEAHNEWQITDAAIIDSCMQALKQLVVGEEAELRAADAGEILTFRMADGCIWTVDFEAGNLLRNGICYETEGWKEVQNILQGYLAEEGLR